MSLTDTESLRLALEAAEHQRKRDNELLIQERENWRECEEHEWNRANRAEHERDGLQRQVDELKVQLAAARAALREPLKRAEFGDDPL